MVWFVVGCVVMFGWLCGSWWVCVGPRCRVGDVRGGVGEAFRFK
jgi:hypothetical protein